MVGVVDEVEVVGKNSRLTMHCRPALLPATRRESLMFTEIKSLPRWAGGVCING
jgi:hypothetical protein